MTSTVSIPIEISLGNEPDHLILVLGESTEFIILHYPWEEFVKVSLDDATDPYSYNETLEWADKLRELADNLVKAANRDAI